MPDQELKEFLKVVVAATMRGDMYAVFLTPIQVLVLHGMVALAMRHPEFKTMLGYAYKEAVEIRAAIRDQMKLMGYTPEQVEELDTREVE